MKKKHVVIVGGGFAGMACANKLTHHPNFHITLIDRNNYNQFKPLLYQVATSALSTDDVACVFRNFFEDHSSIDIKMAEVDSVDLKSQTVKTKDGETYQGDYIVLASGAVVNFFDTKGAVQNAFPLYNLTDAERLRSRILSAFEDADRNPHLIDQGILNFVIVGAGPTGTEIAGALTDMQKHILPREFSDLLVSKAKIYLVDHNKVVLGAFSPTSQEYAGKILQERGVNLKLGLLVQEVSQDYVLLSDGSKILTQTVIWAGGLKASPLGAKCGLPEGHGGRIDVQQDLTVKGFPNVFVIGDLANTLGADGKSLPQLASVAQQSGRWAAQNILADLEGIQRKPFLYHDKGIMAMIGKDAAVAEVGEKRHQFEGAFAFAAWLGVHAALLLTMRQKVEAFVEWGWNYFSKVRPQEIIDRKNDRQG